MSSVRTITRISADSAGGESPACQSDASETLTLGAPWSNNSILTAALTASLTALWDATAGTNPSTFQKLAVYVDPDSTAATVLDVIVEVQVATTLLFFTVNRTAPLIFSKQAADVSLPSSGALTSTINRVRAANHNAAGAANDVKIRLLIFR